MRLMRYPPADWVDIVATRLDGAASTWIERELQRARWQRRAVWTRDVPLAKNPSTGTAQQRLFLVLKVVLHAVVVISEVLRLSTKSRCSRCCRHISRVKAHRRVQARAVSASVNRLTTRRKVIVKRVDKQALEDRLHRRSSDNEATRKILSSLALHRHKKRRSVRWGKFP